MTASCENGIVLAGEHGNIHDVRFYNLRLRFLDAPNRKFFGGKMDFLSGKMEKMVPEGRLYWIYAREASGELRKGAFRAGMARIKEYKNKKRETKKKSIKTFLPRFSFSP